MSIDYKNHFDFSDNCYFDMDSNTVVDVHDGKAVQYTSLTFNEGTVLKKLIHEYPNAVTVEQICLLIKECDDLEVRRIISDLKKKHAQLKLWIPRCRDREYRLREPAVSIQSKPYTVQSVHNASCILKNTAICIRPNFVKEARMDIFEELDEAFQESHVVFLHGIGGIGKSEAAKHWALQKKNQLFDTVVFAQLNSENDNSNVQSLIADDTIFVISGTFRSRDELETTETYFHRKLAKIKQIADERTLIIIDNYDIEDPKLAELFTGPYRLLVTTRNKQSAYDFPVIPVTEIQDTVYLKDIFFKNLSEERDDIDWEDPYIEKLFALVSNHTLTIEIIAKSLVNSADTPETLYLKINDPEHHTLMRNVDGLVERNFSEDPLPAFECVRRLFNLSRLEQDKDFEYKSQVLVFLSAMPIRGLELSLFKKWSDNRIIQAKNSLVQKSWLRQDTIKGVTLISMHPLIREIVWCELKPTLERCYVIIDRFINEDPIYLDVLHHQPHKIKNTYEGIALSLLSAFPLSNINQFEFYLKLHRIFHTCSSPSRTNSFLALDLAYMMKAILEREKQTFSWQYGYINYRIGSTYSWILRDRSKGYPYFLAGIEQMEVTAQTNEEKMQLAMSYREIAGIDCRDEQLFNSDLPCNLSQIETIEKFLIKGENLVSELQKNGFTNTNLDLYHGTVCVWRSRIEIYRGNLSLASALIDTAESEFIRFGYPNVMDKAAIADVRALICADQGTYDKQIAFLMEATKVCENGHGKHHRSSISRAIKLADAYQNNGQAEEAIKILTYYQKIAEEILGDDEMLMVTLRNQLEQLTK